MGSDDGRDSAPTAMQAAGLSTCARCARVIVTATRPDTSGLLCRECFEESVGRGMELAELSLVTRVRLRSGELARDRLSAAAASAGFRPTDLLDGLGRLPDNTEDDRRLYSSVRLELEAQQRWRMRSPAARAGGCGGSIVGLGALAALVAAGLVTAGCQRTQGQMPSRRHRSRVQSEPE